MDVPFERIRPAGVGQIREKFARAHRRRWRRRRRRRRCFTHFSVEANHFLNNSRPPSSFRGSHTDKLAMQTLNSRRSNMNPFKISKKINDNHLSEEGSGKERGPALSIGMLLLLCWTLDNFSTATTDARRRGGQGLARLIVVVEKASSLCFERTLPLACFLFACFIVTDTLCTAQHITSHQITSQHSKREGGEAHTERRLVK